MTRVQKKEKTIAGRIGSAIASILLILAIALLILAIYTMVRAKDDPKNAFLFGYKPVVVETASMNPYILENSIVIIHKTDFTQVKVGDVITYETGGQFVTHRAILIVNNRITVQGDSNQAPDIETVTPENFVGSIAYRMNYMQPVITGFKQDPMSAALRYIVVPIVVIILIYFVILMMLKFIRAGKKNNGN